MYNQFQSSFGQPVQSQYRGNTRQFQPTGTVQSFYGANQQTQGFHTANYVGNQQGHDNYLRADSTRPSSATGMATQSYHTANYAGNQQGHDNYLRADSTRPSSAMGMTAQSYHTANYVGNQQGHDNYLRADSTSPSSFGSRSSFAPTQSFTSTQFGGGFQQQVNPASFHTASYVGNQQGHDNYLRADSTNPSSFGRTQGMGMMSQGFRNV